MLNALRYLAAFMLLMCSAVVSAQTVSRVYITTSNGMNVYNVASTGKLTLVSGSSFKGKVGLAIGTAGTHFITPAGQSLTQTLLTATNINDVTFRLNAAG